MSDKMKGMIFIMSAALSFSLTDSLVKFSGDLPLMQKVFFRNLIALIIVSLSIIKNKQSIIGKNIPALMLRSVFGYLSVIFSFYAISNLLLADTSILQNTSPFFAIIFSLLFLKEPFRKHLVPTLILAFLGAFLVIKPQFNYTIIPSLAALTSGILSGAVFCTIRHLGKTDHPRTIVFWFSAISLLITLPFLFMGQYVAPSPAQWMVLVLIGVCGTLGQFFMTNGYRYAPASELSIYNYTQILFTLIIGMVFWGEFPDFLSLFGGFLILLAACINYRYSIRVKMKKSIN